MGAGNLSQEFRERLVKKTEELETISSIEIVSAIRDRSSNYFAYRVLLGLALAFYLLATLHFMGSHHFVRDLLFCAALFAGVFSLSSIPAVLRLILPHALKSQKVSSAAHHIFLNEEVFATKGRTGVLVYVSLLEHMVLVVGDKGFNSKLEPEYWKGLGEKLAEDFAANRPGESFFAAIDDMIKNVAPKFPPGESNPNELSDHLRKS